MFEIGKRYDLKLFEGNRRTELGGCVVKEVAGTLVKFQDFTGEEFIVNTSGPQFGTAKLSQNQTGERVVINIAALEKAWG